MANLTPKNHAFPLVVVTYGAHRIEGFADQGDAISWSADGDSITITQGPDGELAINKMLDKPATLTLRLMSTSTSIDYLSGLRNVQKQPGFLGPYPACSVVDANTGSTLTADQAWITKAPPVSYGTEASVVEFTIQGRFLQNLSGAAI